MYVPYERLRPATRLLWVVESTLLARREATYLSQANFRQRKDAMMSYTRVNLTPKDTV